MRTKKTDKQYKLWLSANDTYNWAHKPGGYWPCSELSGKRLFAEFWDGDLVDIAVNGKTRDIPSDEFNAIIEDFCGSNRPGEKI